MRACMCVRVHVSCISCAVTPAVLLFYFTVLSAACQHLEMQARRAEGGGQKGMGSSRPLCACMCTCAGARGELKDCSILYTQDQSYATSTHPPVP